MAGLKPGMITGATAKIEVGGSTLAYASDVSYTLTIDHIPVEVMNKYESISHEPIGMRLSGSFSIVRYSLKGVAPGVPILNANKEDTGEKTKEFAPGQSNSPRFWKNSATDTEAGTMNAFSPKDILTSKTFDITIFQRYVMGDGKTQDTKPFLKFLDCKITARSTSLDKRSVMSERFDFVGILMQDDNMDSVAGSHSDTDLA